MFNQTKQIDLMEDLLTDIHEEKLQLTDKEIFTKIWTYPRQVFKFLDETYYDRFETILLVLAGISRTFDRASLKNMGDKMSLGGVIAFCIVAGGLLGWISYYIYAALLSWTGKWLNGQGNTKSILRMLAHAMLPTIVALIFLIPQIIIYGNEVFKSEGDIISAGLTSNIIVYGSMILEFILGVWTIILVVIGLSVVQKISIGKSILNLLLPILIILVPILLIVFLIKAMS